MHKPLRQEAITFGSHEVHSENFRPSGMIYVADSGNGAGLRKNRKMDSDMLNKLLGAAAIAAIAYATCPAQAAKVNAGCSSENLTKTESMVDAMADSDGKMVARKEIAAAQDAMLSGKMGACAAHLNKAAHAGAMK